MRAAPILLLAGMSSLGASESHAQSFDPGLIPPAVRVTVIPRPYTIRGADTPELLTSALRGLGLGGSWTRFSPFYIWRYELEELPLALIDVPSQRCRFPSFEVDL